MKSHLNSSTTLKRLSALLPTPASPPQDFVIPSAPAKSVVTHRGGCCGMAFDCSGRYAATCGIDRTAVVWDVAMGEAADTFTGMLGAVNDVSFTADGARLLGAGGDKSLRLWDVSTGAIGRGGLMSGECAEQGASACWPTGWRPPSSFFVELCAISACFRCCCAYNQRPGMPCRRPVPAYADGPQRLRHLLRLLAG